MGKRKIFIAVEVPEFVAKQLWGVSLSFQKFGYPVSWTEKGKFHITLLYLGYITEEKLDFLVKTLQTEIVKLRSFLVKLEEVGAFPSVNNPRVIVVKAKKGFKELNDINNLLNKLLIKYFKIEKRKFESHVTLGRLKIDDFYLNRKVLEMIKNSKLPNFKDFNVTKITLFESILFKNNFVYQVLLSVQLKK
jgi:RNA 2',3'-cyclic 3'-phosphodiesterase